MQGIHRDGYRVLGIFCVGRRDVAGGVTELHATRAGDSQPPLFRGVLQPGQWLLVNDRVGGVFHYTTPVAAAAPPATGARDVIVLVC